MPIGDNSLCRKVVSFRIPIALVVSLVCSFLMTAAGQGAEAVGAGATFPMPLYLAWARAFRQATGSEVVYQGVGSGEGLKRIEAGVVAFGASDRPLSSNELATAGLVQFATLIGGVLVVVSLPGVDPGTLTLDGPTLGAIMTGRIAAWDAPEIARLNPAYRLPALPIVVIHRSDASGTTFVLSDYLTRAAGGWLGRGMTVPWPGGTAVAGSRGMIDAVRRTPGAIGYINYADAKREALVYVGMINADGRVVQPTPSSFAAASAGADWSDPQGTSLVDRPGGASWPLTTASFVLVRKAPPDPAATASALRFFEWGLGTGASIVEDLDYVPLPAAGAAAARAAWATVPVAPAAQR